MKVSRFSMEIQQVLASAQQLIPILSLGSNNTSSKEFISAPVRVELKNIRCARSGRWVLDGLNLTLTANRFHVLVGESGSGKTTLANVLAGLVEVEHGQVLLNGKCLSLLSEKHRSERIAVAGQDAFLFKGTLRDNLLLAAPTASDEALSMALEVAQLKAKIEELPLGLDTEVEELGTSLSGGEKQRVALARALLSDTPVMILDEVSASLDNLTQQALFSSIRRVYPHKTLLVITHRCSGLELADQISVLQRGRIVASGHHHELLKKNEFYHQLWQHQSASEDWRLHGNNAENNGYVENKVL